MAVTTFHPLHVEVNRKEQRWRLYNGNLLLSIPSQSSPPPKSPKSPSRVTPLPSIHKNLAKMALVAETLLRMLENAAIYHPGKGLYVYNTSSSTWPGGMNYLSYEGLSTLKDEHAVRLLSHFEADKNPVILLHIHDHYSAIQWFWGIIAAGGIPCISTPVSKNIEQREKHLTAVLKLLGNPLVLTTEALAVDFAGLENVRIKTTRELTLTPIRKLNIEAPRLYGYRKCRHDTAVLMLTSGSTGTPKAVALSHSQILHAIDGKSKLHETDVDDVFLNWTGLDHVANLTEIHLHAMKIGANQIHMHSSAILAEPMMFLEKISRHKVTYTFAPNFFLASLVQRLLTPEPTSPAAKENERTAHYRSSSTFIDSLTLNENPEHPVQLPKNSLVNLSSLRALISGGESNVVHTCVVLTRLLQHFGAPKSFIRPGFGMTETCAGSIYNAVDCPSYDVARNAEFACLGLCIPGLEYRICQRDGSVAPIDEIGELQLKGKVVFQKYYNDKCATNKSFTDDGWFKTGDRGFKDVNGRLHLGGRDKDTVVINGVNYHPQAIESAIEIAKIPGVMPSFVVAFAHRPENSQTESVVVTYLPSYDIRDPVPRVQAAASISKVVVTHCGTRPYKILPLDESFLQKTSLGKLSRSKIRQGFEDGVYDYLIKLDEKVIASYKDEDFQDATTPTQMTIVNACNTMFTTTGAKIGITSDLFELGISSIDLLKLRFTLQSNLKINKIPLSLFFSKPLIKDLASTLDNMNAHTYNPIVVLQPHGTKTPLFLIHPGTGEILIFMNLVRHFPNRPIYALRARGFDNEPFFATLEELVTTYHAAIKKVQPNGPYALLGYSFGSFAAFEITKRMESKGDEVKLLAILDQAPYQQERAKSYDWYVVIITISFFLGLIPSEEDGYRRLPGFRLSTHAQVLDTIFNKLAPPGRAQELDLSQQKLERWAELALDLKRLVWDYEPTGMVTKLDVFYTEPLVGLVKAKTTEEWFRDFISKWGPFVKEGGVEWHEVGGTHRTMIAPPHLKGFVRTFNQVLEARGL